MQSVGQLEKRIRRCGNSLHKRMQVHEKELEVLAEAVDAVEDSMFRLRDLMSPDKPLKKVKKGKK